MAVWRQDERRRSNDVNQEIVKTQINQNILQKGDDIQSKRMEGDKWFNYGNESAKL